MSSFLQRMLPGWVKRHPRWMLAIAVALATLILSIVLPAPYSAVRPYIVTAMRWSPDGTRLAVQYSNHAIEILTLDENGHTSCDTLYGEAGWLSLFHREPSLPPGTPIPGSGPLVWSFDGKMLASSDRDGRLKVWDLAGGRDIATPEECALNKGMMSPSVGPYAGGSGPVVAVDMTWSPTNHQLLVNHMTGTWLWDLDALIPVTSVTRVRTTYDGHNACWSPDGQKLAYMSDTSRDLIFYDIETHKESTVQSLPAQYAFLWSPSSSILLLGNEKREMKTLDVANPATPQLRDITGIPFLDSPYISPGGKYVAVLDLGYSRYDGSTYGAGSIPPTPTPAHPPCIYIWNVAEARLERSIPTGPAVLHALTHFFQIEWSRDGRRIASCHDTAQEGSRRFAMWRSTAYALKWWNAETGALLAESLVDVSGSALHVPFTDWLINAANLGPAQMQAWSPDLDKIAISCQFAVFRSERRRDGDYSAIRIIRAPKGAMGTAPAKSLSISP